MPRGRELAIKCSLRMTSTSASACAESTVSFSHTSTQSMAPQARTANLKGAERVKLCTRRFQLGVSRSSGDADCRDKREISKELKARAKGSGNIYTYKVPSTILNGQLANARLYVALEQDWSASLRCVNTSASIVDKGLQRQPI